MSAVDEVELVRQLLAGPGPGPEVTAAGRASLDALAARETPGRQPYRRPHGSARRPALHRSSRARALLACAGAITAAAAVWVVMLWPTAATRTGAGPRATTPIAAGHHQAPAPGSAAVQRAILTAVSSAGGDILYIRRTSQPGGLLAGSQEWFWPSQPVPGQQVHMLIAAPAGVEAEITFTAAAGDQYTSGSSTGPAITGTEVIIDNRAGTWSVLRGVTILPKLPEASSVTQLRSDIAEHLWTIAGPATLAGQAAIELVTTRPGPNGLTERLWVSARTFLPLRQLKQNWNGPGSTLTYDFQYLAATPARYSKLIPPVPAGYRQVPG